MNDSFDKSNFLFEIPYPFVRYQTIVKRQSANSALCRMDLFQLCLCESVLCPLFRLFPYKSYPFHYVYGEGCYCRRWAKIPLYFIHCCFIISQYHPFSFIQSSHSACSMIMIDSSFSPIISTDILFTMVLTLMSTAFTSSYAVSNASAVGSFPTVICGL